MKKKRIEKDFSAASSEIKQESGSRGRPKKYSEEELGQLLAVALFVEELNASKEIDLQGAGLIKLKKFHIAQILAEHNILNVQEDLTILPEKYAYYIYDTYLKSTSKQDPTSLKSTKAFKEMLSYLRSQDYSYLVYLKPNEKISDLRARPYASTKKTPLEALSPWETLKDQEERGGVVKRVSKGKALKPAKEKPGSLMKLGDVDPGFETLNSYLDVEVLPPLSDSGEPLPGEALAEALKADVTANPLTLTKNLLQARYVASDVNAVWTIDWTEKAGNHLLIITDLASKAIVGSSFQKGTQPNPGTLILLLIETIKVYGTPNMIHTDQGGAFMSNEFKNYLDSEDILLSYDDRKLRHFDNQLSEGINNVIWSFLSLTKKEKKRIQAFASTAFATQKNIVLAAVSYYNNLTTDEIKSASPLYLYEALKELNLRLNILTTRATEQASYQQTYKELAVVASKAYKTLGLLEREGFSLKNELKIVYDELVAVLPGYVDNLTPLHNLLSSFINLFELAQSSLSELQRVSLETNNNTFFMKQ